MVFETRISWYRHIEANINKAFNTVYDNRNWRDEDHITRTLLATLRSDNNVKIKNKSEQKFYNINWDIYKNTKQMGVEQKYGDIGLLVKMDFTDSKNLEGAAFLEAKRIYKDSQKFEAMDISQLKNQLKNTYSHRTLLYDFDIWNDNTNKAGAFTLPTQHMVTLNVVDRDIYRYCESFSYLLTYRYLLGYELDYSKKNVDILKGIINANGGVKYLVVANVSNHDDNYTPLNSDINDDIYSKLVGVDLLDEHDVVNKLRSFDGNEMGI